MRFREGVATVFAEDKPKERKIVATALSTNQQRAVDRATAIAQRDSLEVVGVGVASGGQRLYAVPSRSQEGRWHVVVVQGARLFCDCTASQHGRYCAHRAAVRAHLQVEHDAKRVERERLWAEGTADEVRTYLAREQAAQDAREAVEEDAEWCWVPTPAGDEAFAAWMARQDRETAPLARSNAPFSIWKS